MGLHPRPFHYHVWDDPAFGAAAPFGSATVTVPKFSGGGAETRTVYSLKRDLDELRRKGKAKGIVDDSVVSVGKSDGGRDLWAIKVGTGSGHPVLFTGAHHAREWISVEIPYLVAEYLIETHTGTPTTPQEKRIKHLLLNREIWFVPICNPDGHVYTMTKDRNWRPNRKAYNVTGRTIRRSAAPGGSVTFPTATYTGVDINRNYATANWGVETFDSSGHATTSTDPRDGGANSVWCGLSPSGENESAAIDALIRTHRFRASMTVHSFSQLLLFADASSTDAYAQWVGHGMSNLINAGGNPYKYESGSGLYPTSGDLMDFSWQTVAGRPTFTAELRPPDSGPPSSFFSGLPESEIEPCFREMLGASLALINCAGHDAPAANKDAGGLSDMPDPATSAMPNRAICQFVRHCWKVFQGWTP